MRYRSSEPRIFALLRPLPELDNNLFKAAATGNLAAVKEAIANGARLNCRAPQYKKYELEINGETTSNSYFNYTPLIAASLHGHADVVQCILKAAEKIQATEKVTSARTYFNNKRNTASHLAAYNGHTACLKLLIKANTSTLLAQNDDNGFTPLHFAVRNGHVSSVIEIIDTAKVDKSLLFKLLTTTDNDSKTALELAFFQYNNETSSSMKKKYLALFNVINTHSDKAIFKIDTTTQRSNSVVKILWRGDSNNKRNLLTAANKGDFPALVSALNNGANVNAVATGRQYGNYTALIFASRYGHDGIVSYLLEQPTINTRLRTHLGNHCTALHWAVINNHFTIANLLIAKDPGLLGIVNENRDYLPIHYAAENGNIEIVDLLLIKGLIHINAVTHDNVSTPYRLALNHGKNDAANRILYYLAQLSDKGAALKTAERYNYMYQKINMIKNPKQKELALSRLKTATDEEIHLLADIINLLSAAKKESMFNEILNGAHIKIDDKGVFYNRWCKFLGKTPRQSSHASLSQQFSIQGSLIRECLFGDTQDEDGTRYTWLQLERNPTGLLYFFQHMGNFVEYKATLENIGPLGRSKYTDANPFILEYYPSADEVLAASSSSTSSTATPLESTALATMPSSDAVTPSNYDPAFWTSSPISSADFTAIAGPSSSNADLEHEVFTR